MADYDWENEAPWLSYSSSITKVEIANGVTSIGDDAFDYCQNLTSVMIPNSVTSIGASAFFSCSELSSIVIPGSVVKIGKSAFAYCTSLTEVSIPAGTTDIPSAVFRGCEKLTSINVDEANPNYKSIDGVLFTKDGKTLMNYPAGKGEETYTVPDGVISILDSAFERCEFSGITLPASLIYIRKYDFPSKIKSITIYSKTIIIYDDPETIPSNATIYGGKGSTAEEYATKYGRTFKEIDIPTVEVANGTCGESLTWTLDSDGLLKISGTGAMDDYGYIGDAPWYDYRSSITTVKISDGVTSIGNMAFENCYSLKNISMSESVTSIGLVAFYNCSKLASISVNEANANYRSIDGVLFAKDGKTLILYPAGKSAEEYTVPDGVTSIGSWAFGNCISLTSIAIPDSVTSIGDSAFLGCQNLVNVNIPNGVTAIERQTFWDCSSLKSITIPIRVTQIGYNAFYNCSSLESITIYSKTAWIYDESNTIPKSATICGGKGSTAEEYATKYGRTFKEIDIPTVEIANGTCGENLTWTLDSDGLLKISGTGAMADYDWENRVPWYDYRSSITTVKISDGVTSIGNRAFENCYSLKNISMSDGVTSIGNSAFNGCSKLTDITISANVTSIGLGAFYNCSKLASISVNEANANYRSIDGVLFAKDGKTLILYPAGKSAEEYTVPDGVTSIGSWAFGNCISLTSIAIPASVTSIGDFAFYGCPNLTSVRILSKTAKFSQYRFTFNEDTIIYGYEGSTAEEYAKKYNFEFASILSIAIGADDTNESGNEVTIDTTKEIVDNKENQITIKQEVGEKLDGKESANVKTNVAEISFDKTATEKIAESAKKGDINLVVKDITEESQKSKKKIIEISLTDSEGNRILPDNSSEENGYITISILFKAGMDKSNIEVIYKGENGEEKIEIVSYDSDTGIVTFKTKHFSEYEIRDISFRLGDINGDGKIDVKDLVMIRRYMAEYEVDNFNKFAADINGDGKINTTDLVLIRRYLAGISGTGIE